MRRARRTFIALATLGIFGCALPLGPSDDEEEPVPLDEGPSEQELQTLKTNVYVGECYNRVRDRIERSTTRYREFLRWNGGELPESPRRGPNQLDPRIEPAECQGAVERAAAMPPAMPELERAASAYAEQVAAIDAVLTEAWTYYDQGTYRDDGMTRGRALHPRLMAAIEAYETAERAFSGQLGELERARMEARLAELDGDASRRGEYLVERSMFHGRQLVDEGQELIRGFVENGRIDPDARDHYVVGVTQLETEVGELRAHRPAAGEQLPGGYRNYAAQSNNMLRGHLRFMRYVRDTSAPSLERLQAEFQHTIDGFNDAVGAYNDVQLRR